MLSPPGEGGDSLGYGQDGVALWLIVTPRPVPADEKSGLHVCFDAPMPRAARQGERN